MDWGSDFDPIGKRFISHLGVAPEELLCIGQMHYGKEVWLLASSRVVGVPMHRSWCSLASATTADYNEARDLLVRYRQKIPTCTLVADSRWVENDLEG